jgi:nicotinate-nucleotide--dimethylbenzimidazole phosphoribosyltransferase
VTLIESTVAAIEPQDRSARAAAHARLEQLTMPYWALGRLLDLAEELAGMTGTTRPPVARKTIATMVADHGVAAEGVSAYPQEVTVQMVANFVHGGAGINALAGQAGARVVIVDTGVAAELAGPEWKTVVSRRIAAGSSNMAQGPAMTREQAVRAVEVGIELAGELGASTDVFGTGDMGIANTTPSSAIIACLTGSPVAEVTGRGTGVDDAALRHKIDVVERSLAVNQPDADDALDVLAKVGGFEIGGLAGLILGAAAQRKPVVIDGVITTAAALLARGLCPAAADYLIASHRSVEPGHRAALAALGKEPLLDLGFRLGEGTGAALAMNVVEAAARVLTEVATFEEAAVSHVDDAYKAGEPAVDQGTPEDA